MSPASAYIGAATCKRRCHSETRGVRRLRGEAALVDGSPMYPLKLRPVSALWGANRP